MSIVLTIILTVQMLSALAMIGLILVQHGKGADMGAAFGSGSSGSVFGSAGSANFMSRTTAILAVIFFISSIGLTVVGSKKSVEKGLMTKEMPAQPADPAAVHGGCRGAHVRRGACRLLPRGVVRPLQGRVLHGQDAGHGVPHRLGGLPLHRRAEPGVEPARDHRPASAGADPGTPAPQAGFLGFGGGTAIR